VRLGICEVTDGDVEVSIVVAVVMVVVLVVLEVVTPSSPEELAWAAGTSTWGWGPATAGAGVFSSKGGAVEEGVIEELCMDT
jgi:hypothetical protein